MGAVSGACRTSGLEISELVGGCWTRCHSSPRGQGSLPDAVAGDHGEMALERQVLAIEQRDDELDCIGERRRHVSDHDDSGRDAEAPFENQLPHVEVEGQQDSRLRAGRRENFLVRRATRGLQDGTS